jgi:23S rRNA pseudouridine1911/1915/1917 synthase
MQQVYQFICTESDAGDRLDAFLAARLGGLSRMRIVRFIADGACTVNGAQGAAGQTLNTGDRIRFMLTEDAPGAMTPEPLPLNIVYEDEELIVVDKPAGMLVHPTRGIKTGTLANALTYHLNRLRNENTDTESPASINPPSELRMPQSVRPGLIHRLDRATSGLLVVAKTQRALSILTRHFHHRLVEKRYLALVCGRVVADELLIDAPIGRVETERPQWRVTAAGRAAQTRLRVLERRAHTTLVELEPITGRTNQLRIHCAHIGHAVCGDVWYGASVDTLCAAPRLCLHAARLAFHHPTGGRWLEFVSPPPADGFSIDSVSVSA